MKLLKDRLGHKAGTEVYYYLGYTYGLVDEDTRYTSLEHVAVTADGETFFTVPKQNLVE